MSFLTPPTRSSLNSQSQALRMLIAHYPFCVIVTATLKKKGTKLKILTLSGILGRQSGIWHRYMDGMIAWRKGGLNADDAVSLPVRRSQPKRCRLLQNHSHLTLLGQIHWPALQVYLIQLTCIPVSIFFFFLLGGCKMGLALLLSCLLGP